MKIEEIKDSKIWNNFFDKSGSLSFLQSWEWGEFEKKMDYEILRLGIYSSSGVEKNNSSRQARTIKAIAQVIKIRARRGDFLFLPHGPVFSSTINNSSTSLRTSQQLTIKPIITQLLNYLITLAKNENFSFIRIAPILENSPENQKLFADLGFKKAPIYMHAERVWLLPLVKIPSIKLTDLGRPSQVGQYLSDEEMLINMRKTTRYLIRKAQRDGVIIEKRADEKAVDDFYRIYEETAKRENFVPFSRSFIQEEFNAFNKTGNALFLFGKIDSGVVANAPPQNDVILATPNSFRGRPESSYLASALIIFTKSTAFYHQGASIHTKFPVTYLLQWEAIKEAKRRNCQFYNFWGILQEGRSPKNWQGLTLFKTGFGGRQIDYLPTQDYIISPKYYLTYLYEKFLAARRGV